MKHTDVRLFIHKLHSHAGHKHKYSCITNSHTHPHTTQHCAKIADVINCSKLNIKAECTQLKVPGFREEKGEFKCVSLCFYNVSKLQYLLPLVHECAFLCAYVLLSMCACVCLCVGGWCFCVVSPAAFIFSERLHGRSSQQGGPN